MKKLTFMILNLLALLLLLTACSDPKPTPFPVTEAPAATAEPTAIPVTQPPLEQVPTQIPTAVPPTNTPQPTLIPVPTSPFDSMNHMPDPSLTNKTWEWFRRDPNGNPIAEIVVPNPENYTLVFNDDGSLQAQLDCNTGNGRYATENNSRIFMELGASTLSFCNENSLDAQMTMMFGSVQTYHIEIINDELALAWTEGGPIDYFRNADSATTPPEMLGKAWQWQSLESPIMNVTVEAPEKYLIQFNEDGTVDLQADCNVLQAAYTTPANRLKIDLSPANASALLAECPDGALYELYLLALDTTTSFTLLNNNLMLFVGENGNVMRFIEAGTEVAEISEISNEPIVTPPSQPIPDTDEPTGIVTAPDGINMRTGPGTSFPRLTIVPNGTVLSILGISEDGDWWLIENPDLPGEEAWVTINFIQTSNVKDVPVIEEPPALTDYAWQWVSLTAPSETTTVSNPSAYTLQFLADGTAVIKLDCNNANGRYTIDKNAININLGATTLVACPGDSLDALYYSTLTGVTTYFFEGDDLYLELPAGGGTMKFAPIIN
ncbi:MAG: META domain-containing protein [Anaerolineae bacterium]|nr:META domain-containing protein [Anaerolineae bacterium]